MEFIDNLSIAEEQMFQKVEQFIASSKSKIMEKPSNLESGISILERFRQMIYEDLNQIQHEAMILKAARLLQGNDFAEKHVDWYWNPRQTGGTEEPDLRGIIKGRIVLSAEITSSEKPIGSIDLGIRKTLKKLSKMPGKRIYFVRTESMAMRARTKISKAGYQIEVRCI